MDTQSDMKTQSASTISPVDVRKAVRALRTSLKETQQTFSKRLAVGIATAVRYELTLAPHGRMLAKLARIAEEEGFPTQAEVFRDALNQELGLIATANVAIPARRLNLWQLYQPEDLPKAYARYVKHIARQGRSITAVRLEFDCSDGKTYAADVATPKQL